MPGTPTDRDLAESLLGLACMVDGLRSAVSRAVELTPQQAQLLCVLERGAHTHGQLATLLQCDKTNVTGLVDRLERRELVRRELDPKDRRVAKVVLTGAGTSLVARFRTDLTAAVAARLGSWTRPDLDSLTRLAGTAAEALRAQSPAAVP